MYLRFKNGKYHLVWKERQTGKQRSLSLRTSNKKEADRILAEEQAKETLRIRQSRLRTPAEFRHKFSSAFEEFLEHKVSAKNLSQSSIRAYRTAATKWIDVISDKPLYQYSEHDYNYFIKTLRNSTTFRGVPFSQSAIANYTIHLKTIFNYFREKEYIKTNFITRTGVTKSQVDSMPYDILLTILDYLKSNNYINLYNLVYLTFLGAYRKSEVVQARHTDFNFSRESIIIHNDKGKRIDIIPMLSDTREFLEKTDLTKSPLFGYSSKDGMNTLWSKTKRELGIDHTFHSIRKCRATFLANSGASLYFLHNYMRHKDIKTTEQYYLEVDRNKMKDHFNTIISNTIQAPNPLKND